MIFNGTLVPRSVLNI